MEHGIPAQLIDGVEDIDVSWLEDVETVLITAGASAPESVVQGCIQFLKSRYNAVVEERVIREEEVHFPVPRELRNLDLHGPQ